MISGRKITLTVYNVYCGHCGTRGPDGISEVDAHIAAKQVRWEIIENSYICPSPIHTELKAMREVLVEMKVQQDRQADLNVPLLSWWR